MHRLSTEQKSQKAVGNSEFAVMNDLIATCSGVNLFASSLMPPIPDRSYHQSTFLVLE
jgi:hypothetical protein